MKDLLRDCLADFEQKVNQKTGPKEFTDTFCKRCRNPECVNAGWSKDAFSARVTTQVERLTNPTQVDPHLPKYAQIVAAEFKDMIHKAYQLEVADRRGDWEVPQVPDKPLPPKVPVPVQQPVEVEALPEPVKTKLVSPAPQHPKKAQPTRLPAKTNTERKGGFMLDGEPAPQQTAPDPWAPTTVPGEVKVKAGARIKLGADGTIQGEKK